MSVTFLSFTMLALVLFHSPGQFPLQISSAQRNVLLSERIVGFDDWTKPDDAERERWKRDWERGQEKRKRAHEHWKRLEERAREQDKRDLEQWQRDLR